MQEKKQNISPIKQRILQFIDNIGISKREFYEKTGISRCTLESATGITEETLTKFFATYADIDSIFILTGKRTSIEKTNTEEIKCQVKNCDFMEMIDRKDKKIEDMAKEIGRLEQQVVTLKKGGAITSYNLAAEP